ncbi:hypothetical protein Nepgr_007220 [Nepenthes gracilis]|uniref:Uncharacterized protein n=1 Tax=Nepenthes gracilis TaxID=150966 RepID=A0AAD3S6K1_NEPGR|nr:hypothetical protein Nepgr_007220 [Nepenthes gracilis]
MFCVSSINRLVIESLQLAYAPNQKHKKEEERQGYIKLGNVMNVISKIMLCFLPAMIRTTPWIRMASMWHEIGSPVSWVSELMEDLVEEGKLVGGCGAAMGEEERLLEGIPTLDFDMLCSTAAMQSQGKWRLSENDGGEEGGEFAGVFRMWEGEVLDCFDDHRIFIESACCPCYRFGKNMRRAGFGSCLLQGTVYLILAISALVNCIAFTVTRRYHFLYLGVAISISLGIYLGFLRTKIKKKFNIRGNDGPLDDCVYHLICPCCTICQESRTLKMNNVQDGTWHGRGDTICIGSFIDGKKTLFGLQLPPSPILTKPDNPHELQRRSDFSNQC